MENAKIEMLPLSNEKEIRMINTEKLLAVKVEDYLCTFYIEAEEQFVCTKSLTEIEKILPECFIKISRNTIINKNKCKSLRLKENKMILTSGDCFIYPKQNMKRIKELLGIKQ